MNVFMYSSPYQYYVDNLLPIYFDAIASGHKAYGAYRLSEAGHVFSFDGGENNYLKLFYNRELKVDAVILVQAWWYEELEIIKFCKKNKIPFYIVDHAAPMFTFAEPSGKKSHMYRADCNGARIFFAYGQATVDVMRKRGSTANIKIVGSPRVELDVKRINSTNPGAAIFDTSARMDDKNIAKSFSEFFKEKEDVVIRKHSRSAGNYDYLVGDKIKISANDEFEDLKRQELYFSFPSSAMITAALAGRDFYALYKNHWSQHTRNYFAEYKDAIPAPGQRRKSIYSYIVYNILYNQEKASTRILDQISYDIKKV
jgi:hypothetical protein